MIKLLLLITVLFSFMPYTVYASDNVTVNLTTNVIPYYSGGGGGGSWFDSGDIVPYTPPDWTKIFPSMITGQETQGSSYIPPVQQPIFIPPVVGNPPQYITPTAVPLIPEGNEEQDVKILAFIGIGVILLGIILYLIIPEQRVR
jgi:hypothetical protein